MAKKPEFDPRKDFEHFEEKPAFNPDAHFQVAGQDEEAGPTAGRAFHGSFANGATLGYVPQIEAAFTKAALWADDKVHGTNNADLIKYVDLRDDSAKELAEAAKEHPAAALAGNLTGGVAAGVATGGAGAAVKGASLAQKLKAAAKVGAVLGAVANPGDVEGEVSPVQLEDRLKNAGIGAAVGAGAAGAVEGIGAAGSKASEFYKDLANEKAYRALGRQTPTAMAKAKATGMDQILGRTLLDEGAVPVLGTPGRIQGRVEGLKEAAGSKVGELIRNAGDGPKIDAERIALEIMESPEIAQMRKVPGMEGMADKVEKSLETLASNGNMSLEQAQALRQSIDESINFGKRVPEMSSMQEYLHKMRTAVRDKMSDAIDAVHAENGTPTTGALKTANRSYGNLAEAEKILDKEVGRQANNRAISLTDTIAAASGASAGNPALAIGLGAANKFGRTFGNSIQARGYDATANALAKVPRFAEMATKNPTAFQMLANRMAGKATGTGELEASPESPIFQDRKLMERFRKDPSLVDSIKNEKLRSQLKSKLQDRSPSDEPISEDQARQNFIQGN